MENYFLCFEVAICNLKLICKFNNYLSKTAIELTLMASAMSIYGFIAL